MVLDGSEFSAVRWEVGTGDLLDQVSQVDALVNPWNRNVVPRCLLIPSGVSGALKRLTGPRPWRELARQGALPLGAAVSTSGGRVSVDLIHVAGINLRWRASEQSVYDSTVSAVRVALTRGYRVVAAPLVGAGHGGLSPVVALGVMTRALMDGGARQASGDVVGAGCLVRIIQREM